MSYFYFDNKKIYYTEQGNGTPLLLLHGNTASSNMFYHISDIYAKDYKVIMIDFLGHGKSDRLEAFPTDLWYYEAEQVIAFLKEKQYNKVNLIGTSGGALVAINVALEVPEMINKIIADSFEGERSLKAVTEYLRVERESSKQDENGRMFYNYMHGEDWENVVDNDTDAVIKHDKEIGNFFHKSLSTLQTDILLTGSKEDEFVSFIAPNFFETVYGDIIDKVGHGQMHLFEKGGHPALLSSHEAFYEVSKSFFDE